MRMVMKYLWCVLFLGASGMAWAQNARFTGQVTDPQNAVVPNAQVRVLNQDTGVKIETKTDSSGNFTVPYLAAGHYQIEVGAEGFNRSVRNDVLLNVGQAFIYNVQLTVGSTTSNVTVEGGAASAAVQVNTENAEVSGTIIGKEVQGLELNGRNYTQLIDLTPGVSNQTSQDEAKVGVLGSVSYSVNGGRVEYNSFQVDGSETLNTGINKDINTLIVYPSVDAIQEIKVLTSNYGAQYPSTGNGTTIVTTKSGTDSLHGSVYEFLRNEAFNSKGYFDVTKGAPEYRRNDFGGTIGGPLYIPHLFNGKGKTHFFISEEARLEITPTAYRQAVPSLQEQQGIFNDVCPPPGPSNYAPNVKQQYPDCPTYGSPTFVFANNNINDYEDAATGINPAATALLTTGIIPAPTATSGCNSTVGSCYLADVPLPTYFREELARIDHNIGSKNQVTFRYIHDAWNTTTPIPQFAYITNSFPTVQNFFTGPGLSLAGRLTTAFSPKLLNDFVVSYTDSHITLADEPGQGVSLLRPAALDAPPSGPIQFCESCGPTQLGAIFNNGFGGKIPGIVIGGTNAEYGGAGFSVDTSYMPWEHKNPVFSLSDNVTKLLGRHTFTFGGQWLLWNRTQTNDPIGAATGDVQGIMGFNENQVSNSTGNAFADFLILHGVGSGLISSPMYYFQQDSSQGQYHQRFQIAEPYFQDDWKATSRLTVNAGLRVSLFGTFREVNRKAYNWVQSAYQQVASVDPEFGELYNASGFIPFYLANGQVNPLVIPGIVQCGANGVPSGCMSGHLWNPAPRVGFSWDVRGNGKTAIRAGYGIFFEHGTADEANSGSLEASAPLVLSATQTDPLNWSCIGNPSAACYADLGYSQYPLVPGTASPVNVTSIPTKAVWSYVQQWSASIEQEVRNKYLLTVGYVGSKGTHLTLERQLNQLQPVTGSANPFAAHEPLGGCPATFQAGNYVGQFPNQIVLPNGTVVTSSDPAYKNILAACNTVNINSLRQFAPGLGEIFSLENTANSSYNALQVTLRRTAGPLTLGVAYTYSHSIDNSSDRSDATFVNSYDVAANRASSNFDQRHLLHISYIYDFSLRRSMQRFLSTINADPDSDNHTKNRPPSAFTHSGLGNALADHWQLSGITVYETGIPFTVVNNGSSGDLSVLDNAGVGNGVGAGSYPDLCGNPHGKIPAGGNNSLSFGPMLLNPGAFCAPTGLTFGDAGRNDLRNPSRTNFDMALVKHFDLPKEFGNLEFRAEAFNVFNHTQFRLYDPILGNQPSNEVSCYAPGGNYSAAGGDGTDCLTGQSFLHPVDAHRPRTLQLGLKLAF